MPGPLINPQRSPILDMLPRPVSRGLEAFFPADDIVGPAMPGTAITAAPRGLIEALTPLAGSIDETIDLGKSFAKDPFDFIQMPSVTRIFQKGRGVTEEARHHVYKMLRNFGERGWGEEAKDPLKILAMEKIQSRVPQPSKVIVEGMELTPEYASRNIERSPLMEQLFSRQEKFDKAQKSVQYHGRGEGGGRGRAATGKWLNTPDVVKPGEAPMANPSRPAPDPNRKPLLGRWSRPKTQASSQGKSLNKAYSKKPVGKE